LWPGTSRPAYKPWPGVVAQWADDEDQVFDGVIVIVMLSKPDWVRGGAYPQADQPFSASGIGLIQYLDRALSAPDAHHLETYRLGVYVLDAKAEEILGEMGATKTWRGDSLTGVGSSRDFGGARMADERQNVVVNSELRVHDTPGLHVYSGAAFRTRSGINPTLSLLALCTEPPRGLSSE
jgi:hypothetical protein